MVSLPKHNERILIVGRTGSGKTVFALFVLSQMDFHLMPWVIIDFKGDENLNSIVGAKYVSISNSPPTEPGIYILRPNINQKAEVENYLWQIWEMGGVGLFIDEAYMLGQGASFSAAFRAILTQGRSKGIGVIINSQRPVWLDNFAISESNKIAMFHLNSLNDRKKMAETIGGKGNVDVHEKLDNYHSIYYDINTDTATELAPAPSPQESLTLINARLAALNQSKENPSVDVKTSPYVRI